MAKSDVMTIGKTGVEIAIEYNEVNHRVTQLSWSLVAGHTSRCRIWNSGNLVVDRTAIGPNTGAESVPGQVRMVEVTMNGSTYWDLPPNITWILNIASTV